MKQKYSLIVVGLLWALGGPANAQAEKPEITFSGFFDGYYSYNFNSPKQSSGLSASTVSAASIPPATNVYRYYDAYHNQPTLSLAELTVKVTFKEVSLLLDFDFGSFADLNASSSSSAGAVVDESSKHIGQAVLSYRAEGSRFSIDAGKMYSHLGVETVKSKDNFNYSRSILFSYALPFWHTGARIGYDLIPNQLQTSLFVYNGWNTQYDANRTKSLGAQVRYVPSESVVITYNFIGGPERADTESDFKVVHEINGAVRLTEVNDLILDAAYGSEENAAIGASRAKASWYGGLIALRHKPSSVSYLSPRIEVYRDNDGYSLNALPQTINSLTITYGREITTGLEVRLEGRGDFSDQNSFMTDSGTSKSQTTIIAAGLFKF